MLEEFLSRQRAEVKAMSIFEYDEARELKLLRESYYEEGRNDGRNDGIISTLTELVREQILSVQDAAGRAGMSEEAFAAQMRRSAAGRE